MFAVLEIIVAVVSAGICFLLGRQFTLRSLNHRIAEAYNKGRAEVEAEKMKFAVDVKDRLLTVKQSLKSVVESYDAAAKVVRDTLAVDTDGKSLDGSPLALEDLKLEILPVKVTSDAKADLNPPAPLSGTLTDKEKEEIL